MMAKFGLTLLLCLSFVLALAISSNASAFDSQRRNHADLGRFVKKRAATPTDQPSAQSQQSPSPSAVQASSSPTAQTTPTTSAESSAQTTAQVSSAAASLSSSASSVLASLTDSLTSTGSSSGASSASAAATTPSTSNPAASTPQTSGQPQQASGVTPSNSVVVLTTGGAATPTPTSSDDTTSSGISHTAVTILIIIAASIGASVIIWTVIRKLKFRPSSDFDSRMQPIDWHPGGNEDDAGQRRMSRASSFHSGPSNAPTDDDMRGMGGYAPSLGPIPDHDFTAGPAQFAPVGGYADLARGPSPQPMMQEPLGRSLTVNRPQYDQFGVPLHHGY